MGEKRIEIIDDIENIVTFDTIVRDKVDRTEVANAEERISLLEREIAEKNAELEALKERVAYAKEIIALADAKKAEQVQTQEQEQEHVEEY